MNSNEAKKNIPGFRDLPSTRQIVPRKQFNHLLPTLFDRLNDLAPNKHQESPEEYTINKTQFKEIISRDLTYLLNTVSLNEQFDHDVYPNVASSTINYGVPALAGSYMSEHKWEDIEKMIRKAINDFEPRLIPSTVAVNPINKNNIESNYNVLRFSISGKIHMEPYPVAFTVQSSLDLESNRIEFY